MSTMGLFGGTATAPGGQAVPQRGPVAGTAYLPRGLDVVLCLARPWMESGAWALVRHPRGPKPGKIRLALLLQERHSIGADTRREHRFPERRIRPVGPLSGTPNVACACFCCLAAADSGQSCSSAACLAALRLASPRSPTSPARALHRASATPCRPVAACRP